MAGRLPVTGIRKAENRCYTRSSVRTVSPSRGAFPLYLRPGERIDHPHHVGLWFNYGDVNGLDFERILRR